MLKFRALLSGRTRPANRFLDAEQKEAYTSVTSFEENEGKSDGASTKAKTKRYVGRRREQSSHRKICNNILFIGSILLRRRIPERERITIHCLDDSLLTRVYQYLPLVDQVCLSLSCKRFLSRYKTLVNKDSSSMLPPQPTDHHLPLSYVNSEDKLRVHLLIRLEDLRWAYCAECLSLKPRSLFTPDALKAPTLERRCARYAGVIELCPCLHLTLRDRNNVRLLLRSPDTPCGVRYGFFSFELDGGRFDGHLCSFYSNENRKVRVFAEVYISNTGFLFMQVEYNLRVSSSGDSFVEAGPVFACPHLDLIPLIHTAGDVTQCYQCNALVLRKPERHEEPSLVTFSVNQNLGWSDLSDDVFWHFYCYDPKG